MNNLNLSSLNSLNMSQMNQLSFISALGRQQFPGSNQPQAAIQAHQTGHNHLNNNHQQQQQLHHVQTTASPFAANPSMAAIQQAQAHLHSSLSPAPSAMSKPSSNQLQQQQQAQWANQCQQAIAAALLGSGGDFSASSLANLISLTARGQFNLFQPPPPQQQQLTQTQPPLRIGAPPVAPPPMVPQPDAASALLARLAPQLGLGGLQAPLPPMYSTQNQLPSPANHNNIVNGAQKPPTNNNPNNNKQQTNQTSSSSSLSSAAIKTTNKASPFQTIDQVNVRLLESLYRMNDEPEDEAIELIADRLNCSHSEVASWFKLRRDSDRSYKSSSTLNNNNNNNSNKPNLYQPQMNSAVAPNGQELPLMASSGANNPQHMTGPYQSLDCLNSIGSQILNYSNFQQSILETMLNNNQNTSTSTPNATSMNGLNLNNSNNNQSATNKPTNSFANQSNNKDSQTAISNSMSSNRNRSSNGKPTNGISKHHSTPSKSGELARNASGRFASSQQRRPGGHLSTSSSRHNHRHGRARDTRSTTTSTVNSSDVDSINDDEREREDEDEGEDDDVIQDQGVDDGELTDDQLMMDEDHNLDHDRSTTIGHDIHDDDDMDDDQDNVDFFYDGQPSTQTSAIEDLTKPKGALGRLSGTSGPLLSTQTSNLMNNMNNNNNNNNNSLSLSQNNLLANISMNLNLNAITQKELMQFYASDPIFSLMPGQMPKQLTNGAGSGLSGAGNAIKASNNTHHHNHQTPATINYKSQQPSVPSSSFLAKLSAVTSRANAHVQASKLDSKMIDLLEAFYKLSDNPEPSAIEMIARRMNVQSELVADWFDSKRFKLNPNASPRSSPAKKREGGRVVTFSEYQRGLLEAIFDENNYLHPQEYEELSNLIQVPSRNIKIWFKNRRSKQRLSGKSGVNSSTNSTPSSASATPTATPACGLTAASAANLQQVTIPVTMSMSMTPPATGNVNANTNATSCGTKSAAESPSKSPSSASPALSPASSSSSSSSSSPTRSASST